MSGASADNISIVLVGRRADGAPSTLEILPPGSRSDGAAAARAFLTEHRSCQSVELWTNDQLLGSMARGDANLTLTDQGCEVLG